MTSPIDSELWRADLTTVAVLAIVLWLDGWRRVSDDAIVVRRSLLAPWRIVSPSARIGTFAFLAWWPPFVMPHVITTPGSAAGKWTFDVGVARAARRRRRIRWDMGVVRFLSAFLVLWIALGIPLLTARLGLEGLIRGIASAILLAATVAVLTMNALRSLGLRWRQAARRALPLLSPFGAPRAPELLVSAALADVGPLASLRVLLGDEAFGAWLRPSAYDALKAGATPVAISGLPRTLLERAVARPTGADPDERYCARCGRTYRHTVTTCAECGDLPLT